MPRLLPAVPSRALRSPALVTVVGLAAAAVLVAGAGPATAAQPGATVHTGAATVTQVTVNGGSTNYGFVSAGGDVTVSGRVAVGDTGTALDQVQVGWAGSAAPVACLYDGRGSAKHVFSVDLGAPPGSQSTAVVVNFAQDFSCDTSQWWSGSTGPAIAEVAVTPATTVVTGPVTYTRAGIDALGADPVVRGAGSEPGLRVTYSIADTGGITDALLIGWAGAASPVGCLYSGPGNQPAKTVTFRLGTPPRATGANYVLAATYPSCDLTRWKSLAKKPLAVLYVDRDL